MDSGVIGIVLAHPRAFGSYRLAKNKWMFIISICPSTHEFSFIALAKYMGDPPPPLKNHKNIRFFSNTGPEPMKNHKATMPLKPAFKHSMLGHHRPASETPFNGVSLGADDDPL